MVERIDEVPGGNYLRKQKFYSGQTKITATTQKEISERHFVQVRMQNQYTTTTKES